MNIISRFIQWICLVMAVALLVEAVTKAFQHQWSDAVVSTGIAALNLYNAWPLINARRHDFNAA